MVDSITNCRDTGGFFFFISHAKSKKKVVEDISYSQKIPLREEMRVYFLKLEDRLRSARLAHLDEKDT